MGFLKRRISATVWELLILLVVAIIFTTGYRIYFSRAVALTQVCEKFEALQNDETADMFSQMTGESEKSLKEINLICQVRRPLRN